jgi:hypothetical protein
MAPQLLSAAVMFLYLLVVVVVVVMWLISLHFTRPTSN